VDVIGAFLVSQWKDRVILGLLCVLFASSFGAFYGISDQNSYMLHGLRLADPSFLTKDWFINETDPHHKAFTFFVYILAKIGPISWMSKFVHVSLITLLALSNLLILKSLYSKPFLPFIFSLTILHLAVGLHSLLSHPFMVPWLTPNGMASIFFILGAALFIRSVPGQIAMPVSAGLSWGLSGLFHITFMIMIPLFLIGILIYLRKTRDLWEILAIVIPFVLLTIPLGVLTLQEFLFRGIGEGIVEKLDAFARFRMPHHYLPREWGIPVFAHWGIYIVLGVIGLVMFQPDGKHAQIVLATAVSLFGIFSFVFFCTVIFFIPQIAFLQSFRFVALLAYFSLLFFAGTLAQVATSSGYFWGPDRHQAALLGVGLLLIVFTLQWKLGIFLVLLFVICRIGIKCKPLFDVCPKFVHWFLIVITFLFLLYKTAAQFSPEHPYLKVEGAELFKWIRGHTSPHSLFVVPPDMSTFRLQTQRSIVVDLKAHPFDADGIDHWRNRLNRICGRDSASTIDQVKEGYNLLDSDRAIELARQFSADYLVIYRTRHRGDLRQLSKIYSDSVFAVYGMVNRLNNRADDRF
jgi:hypothetical protein